MVLFQHLKNFFIFLKNKLSFFLKKSLKATKDFLHYLKEINPNYRVHIENCQLSSIYLLCFISTAKYLKSVILYYPPLIRYLIPFCETICDSPFFAYVGNTDASMFYYPLLTQIVFQRRFERIIKFSDKIRFHITYVLLLDLFQTVVMYWALLYFSPEFSTIEEIYLYLPATFSFIFLVFYLIFLYSYIAGLRSLVPVLKGPFKLLKPFVENSAFSVGLMQDDLEIEEY
jgi:hypothetical protein